MNCRTFGEFGTSLGVEGLFGAAGAYVFTSLNPVVGAAFGVTSALISGIAKVALDKFAHRTFNDTQRKFLSVGIGIIGGAVIAGAAVGGMLSASAALGLFVSIFFAKILFNVASSCCCQNFSQRQQSDFECY